jgi:hypothetical protein
VGTRACCLSCWCICALALLLFRFLLALLPLTLTPPARTCFQHRDCALAPHPSGADRSCRGLFLVADRHLASARFPATPVDLREPARTTVIACMIARETRCSHSLGRRMLFGDFQHFQLPFAAPAALKPHTCLHPRPLLSGQLQHEFQHSPTLSHRHRNIQLG